MSNENTFHLPELPKLPAGHLVVTSAAWDTLLRYISAQTSTINALTDTVSALSRLHDLHSLNMERENGLLKAEVAELAQALEGVYTDE